MTESASQTAGPYVHIGLTPNAAGVTGVFPTDLGATMRRGGHRGEAITLSGRILDGAGEPLRDALVEIWQADADGRFAGEDGADPHFTGWGRCPCDPQDGTFRFDTVMPGPVADMAPHILIWIVARGINIGLQTRIYFDGEPRNDTDPVLSAVAPDRRATLLASAHGPGAWRFDVTLQGDQETVFFDM